MRKKYITISSICLGVLLIVVFSIIMANTTTRLTYREFTKLENDSVLTTTSELYVLFTPNGNEDIDKSNIERCTLVGMNSDYEIESGKVYDRQYEDLDYVENQLILSNEEETLTINLETGEETAGDGAFTPDCETGLSAETVTLKTVDPENLYIVMPIDVFVNDDVHYYPQDFVFLGGDSNEK